MILFVWMSLLVHQQFFVRIPLNSCIFVDNFIFFPRVFICLFSLLLIIFVSELVAVIVDEIVGLCNWVAHNDY